MTFQSDPDKCSERQAISRGIRNAVLKAVRQNDRMENIIYREALLNAAEGSKMKRMYIMGAITLMEYLSWESNL